MIHWWLWLVFPALLALILWGEIKILTHASRPVDEYDGAAPPPGWEIKRRGLIGHRRWDAYNPIDERWLGWRYHWRSWAVQHAWTVHTFDQKLIAMGVEIPRPDRGE